jgi:HEAT repeat protein
VLIAIIDILKNDAQAYVRAHAATAIAGMSGDRQPALAPLTEALGDPDPNVRKSAAIALGSMGPAASSALPALRQALLEARCGIPGQPKSSPGERSFVLSRDNQELNSQMPLVQALLGALREIERSE